MRSDTLGLSSLSQGSAEAILAVLSKHYSQVKVTAVNNLSDLRRLGERQPDLVFLGMKYVPVNEALGMNDPEKVWLADYLEERGTAYTGSSQPAHRLESNKSLAKQRALDAGLKTSPFYISDQNEPTAGYRNLSFPMFVKPANRGGGLGIDSDSVVQNSGALNLKIQSITDEYSSDSLVEEYLAGREFSVAILKDEYSSDYFVMPLELIAPPDKHGDRLLSAEVKDADTEEFTEVNDAVLKAKVSSLAINVFHALQARDYGRIDIRLDGYGTPHFLEANLLPSLIKGYGNFPKACLLNINLGYENMLLTIVRLALTRAVPAYEDALLPRIPLIISPSSFEAVPGI